MLAIDLLGLESKSFLLNCQQIICGQEGSVVVESLRRASTGFNFPPRELLDEPWIIVLPFQLKVIKIAKPRAPSVVVSTVRSWGGAAVAVPLSKIVSIMIKSPCREIVAKRLNTCMLHDAALADKLYSTDLLVTL